MNISNNDIDIVLEKDDWTFCNSILYNLCSDNFEHNKLDIIMAKVCIIGRVYAASIERRPVVESDKITNDQFYLKTVAPGIKDSDIDKWLKELKRFKKISEENLPYILDTHNKVTDLFSEISGLEKRSLASKYLHFHLPDLFYIYDSRAVKGLRKILPRFRLKNNIDGYDDKYSKFCQKLFYLRQEIEKKFGAKLDPRQLDRLLLLKS